MARASPSTREARTVGELGENALIRAIARWLGPASLPSPRGIGDDCAVWPASRRKQLVTVDPVIRGRHFDDGMPPALVAEKLLKRNLSDIAAMGGTPTRAVVAIAAPSDLPAEWLRRFYRRLGQCAQAYGVAIVGGDCTQSTDGFLGAFLTLIGFCSGRVLTRTGGRAGDVLFVSGKLGGSLLSRHARFTPRLEEGAWLASQTGVHAAIDLSDGLGKDLSAIVSAKLIAAINTDELPASKDAARAAQKSGRPLLDHVLNDGEDFELLFSVSHRQADGLAAKWRKRFTTPLTRIGRLEAASPRQTARVRFDPPLPEEVNARGYEHFA